MHSISDVKLSLEERLPTCEGNHKNSVEKPMKGDLTKKEIDRMCQMMILHLNSMTKDEFGVGSLNLHFRIDRDNQLWLLFCNSIRLVDSKAKKSKGEEDIGRLL